MERIATYEDLERAVERIGFLPLSGAPFSLEKSTDNAWHDGSGADPWLWRERAAREGRMAYGKFFLHRSGFIARRSLPDFIAVRRDGRGMEALYADGLVSRRARAVYGCFADAPDWAAFDLKRAAGFSGAQSEFEAAMEELQALLLIVVSGQARRANRLGEPYGWRANRFCRVEVRFPGALDAREARERLLAGVQQAGPVPHAAALRLISGGSAR